jgi:DNA-binding helix-hairpin-helix protein with protein kinase domain
MNDEVDLAELGQLGDRIGKGGQAVVYLVPGLTLPDVSGPLAYKAYLGQQSAPHGFRAIVRVRSAMDVRDRQRLDTIAAWPARVVRSQGQIVGVLMPLIPDSFFQRRTLPSGRPSRDPREAQNLFVAPELAARLGMPSLTGADRFAVCRDLAGALSFLHAKGIVFGDLNAKNELFRLTPEPTVMLVDCDAVRIRGSAAVVRQLSAPDWDPPEGVVLTQATDVYKLALFVLRVLSPGPQASTARDPERVRRLFDAEGWELLVRSLSARAKDRPAASAWYSYLALRTPRRTSTAVAPMLAARPSEPRPPMVTSGWRRDPATGQWVPAT